MIRLGLILSSLFLIGCINISIPRCDKCSPCRTDISSSQYNLSPILEVSESEIYLDEKHH